MSELKHLQRFMTSFNLDFIIFEHQPQSDQPFTIFKPSIELIFETLETDEIYMHPYHSMTDHIINRNLEIHFTIRMDQINVNPRTKIPAINIITAPLDNSTRTEILVNNIKINIIVNNINPDTYKDIEHFQFHT